MNSKSILNLTTLLNQLNKASPENNTDPEMLLEVNLMIKLPKQRVFVLFANKYGLLNKNFEELQYPLQSANQNFDVIVSSKAQKK